MITERQYNKAKKIVKQYEQQLNILAVSNSYCDCDKPKCNISGMAFCICCNKRIPDNKLKINKDGLVLGILEDN